MEKLRYRNSIGFNSIKTKFQKGDGVANMLSKLGFSKFSTAIKDPENPFVHVDYSFPDLSLIGTGAS